MSIFWFKFIFVCDLLCPKKSLFSRESKVALVVLSGMTFYGGEFLIELVLNCQIFVGSAAVEYYRGYLVSLNSLMNAFIFDYMIASKKVDMYFIFVMKCLYENFMRIPFLYLCQFYWQKGGELICNSHYKYIWFSDHYVRGSGFHVRWSIG